MLASRFQKSRRELRSSTPSQSQQSTSALHFEQFAAAAKSIEVATNNLRGLALTSADSPQPNLDRVDDGLTAPASTDNDNSISVSTEVDNNDQTSNDPVVNHNTSDNKLPVLSRAATKRRKTSLPVVLSAISVRLGAALSELQGLANVLSDITSSSIGTTNHQPKRKFSHIQTANKTSNQPARKRKPQRPRTSKTSDSNSGCTVCGRGNHMKSSCHFLEPDGTSWHPNANLSNEPWATSDFGRQVAEKLGVQILPTFTDVDGNHTELPTRLNLVKPQSGPK